MVNDGSHGDGSAASKKATTQSLYREVNERIHEVNTQRALLELPEELVCECAKPECSELIEITAMEYQGLRAHSTWFLIAPSDQHFFPDIESIVAKNGHYWIVEKHDRAALIAEQLDPR
jgi:hypothetical protein